MRSLLIIIGLSFMVSGASGQTCEALFTFDATPLTIHFQDLSTHGANDPIVSWDWDFDDGSGSSQQNPTHTFPAPDRYDVVLNIETQSGCNSSIEIRIEICDFGVNYTVGTCNANGLIPTTFNITDIYDNATEIDVILDGQSVPGSPFEIDQDNPVLVTVNVPGNGLQHTINIQSTDIETCGRTITFTTEDCSSNCFLSSLQVGFSGGTTHNVTVGDDFFAPQSVAIVLGDVVHFTWQGSGHSTTSDATSGNDAWNSGVIGGGSTFDVIIDNPGVHPYYCQPHGGPNGVGMSGQILSNCPGGSTLPLQINFNTSVANPAGYNILWDNQPVPGSPFQYSGTGPQTRTINIAGNGMPHSLIIRDVADPTCELNTTYNAPDCNQGGGNPVCGISGTVGNFGGCNNNNVTATLTVNVTNGGTGFNVSIDNGANQFFAYSGNTTIVTITLPGNGASHSVRITDNVDPTCTSVINVTTPNCSLPCSITNLQATAASGSGGPSGIVHTVNVQDFVFNPNVVNMTVGDIVQWVWTGAIPHTSTSDAASGPNSWDSGLLNNGATYNSPLLAQGEHRYYCEPHGAPGGVGMSGTIFVLPPCNAQGETPVQVSFTIQSNGTQGFQVLVDGVVAGTFPYVGGNAQSASVLVAGDGQSHTILVRDVANQSCNASTTVITADCNGGGNPECSINATIGNFSGCSNNNVTAPLTVTVTNGGTGFNLSIDNGPNQFHAYTGSTTTITITLPGNGGNHTVKVTDNVDPLCTHTLNVTTPNCSLPCTITNLQATAASGSGGPSGIVHTVNVQDFVFNPNVVNITVGDVVQWVWTGAIPHTSTSDATSGPNSWNSGLLNTGATYTSPLLAEGTHPYYCAPHGAPGGVGMAGSIFVLPPCNSQGETPVQVTFNIQSNGTQGFQVLVDGIVEGTFQYVAGSAQSASVNVPGNAMSHTIQVRDVANQSCNASTTVTTPDCNGGGNPQCTVSVTATIAGGCTNNTVPVSLDVNATNNSTTFSVTVDGANAGTFNYSAPTVTINIIGDGNAHTIVVTDSGDPACTATTQITTPNCALPCMISNVTASTSGGSGQTGVIHTVNVEDFQFNPNSINITVGDVVRWVWTGAIPHTSTSDISSGANSWDSGLLGNGAVYTSPVLTEGVHPYYCIPHGSPGGIGMAATIHVLPPCNSFGQTNVQVNFLATNGGPQGYNVVVDGNVAGTFSYVPGAAQSATVLVAGNGMSHTIVVRDVANASCSGTVNVITPDCGGGGNPECSVTLNPTVNGGCNAGLVSVLLNVSAINNSSSYSVTVDGQAAGNFTYSNNAAAVNIAGNGLSHTIVITDGADPSCTATSNIITPNCSIPCGITIQEIAFGTNGAHTVQVQDFQFSPEEITINLGDTLNFVWTGVIPHTVTSDSPAGPNAFNSGLLGQGATWQLIPGTTGSFPYYCIPHGAPGGVGMAGTINVISSCTGSTANGNMVIQYVSTSGQGFAVLNNGTPVAGSPFAFSNTGSLTIPLAITGDGAAHTFTVSDIGNNSCSATQTVTVPSCNSSSCSLTITQASVSACMGNTVTLTVAFSSNQNAATYNVYKDGLKLNPQPLVTNATGAGTYSTMIVGNNITSNITIQFIENTSCSATQSIVIPGCAGPCLISEFIVGQGGSKHTVEVKDFVFEPASIDVLIGDTVHFVWTGVIPHTTTSDQFMGPNSWNSGLLGQGATYDLVIGEMGTFPYYCQPHGGPGGIGMTGVINVIDTCEQEDWLTNMSFLVSAGSPLGYNVFVDGVKITPTPLQYDDPVGFNDEIIGLPGDGAWHLVTIQDLETGFCAYTTPVQTSICGAGCSVINLAVNTGTNIIHVVEVRDFDYFPADIVVGAGETIRFVWTGEIPHTVTSDAVNGPEVWNSGLLGQGATFDLIINTPGVHPYFCLPHGGPGGIGMSGVITVIAACADNNQNVKVNFDITNGSLLGYNLFVDGVPFGNNPRQYDDRTGSNQVSIAHPADNATHILTIQDLDNNICAASEFFTVGTCNADCELNDIDYFLGNGRKHEVLVRDFDYDPAQINVEVGDTIHFLWTGAIPHTVTSDIAAGPNSFNSGLLGKGSEWDLVITSAGNHPYYCIPHGAPGGIGMAGSIHATDPCDDGNVFVDFRFFSEGTGVSFDVTNNGNIVLNDQPYITGGIQLFKLELPAQGQTHNIQVSDNGPDDCIISIALDSFDCSDPCFLVRSDFEYDINFSTLEVSFTDQSKGNIVAWAWSFGDGFTSTERNPVHTFSQTNLYQVCLTITDANGCAQTFCDRLSLGSDVCNAGFTYQQNGLDFVFFNTSDVSSPNVGATWTFGDGNTSTQFDSTTHSYSLGLYEVCITATSTGCVNTYCETLDLRDSCLALRADYVSTNVGGDPRHYQFTDQSGGPIGSRLWGFGDGQISTDDNPYHQFSSIGVYTVCLLVLDNAGNCTDSDCRTLYVGTTGTGPNEVQMKKILVVPNPVSISSPEVNIRGFDINDIGREAQVVVLDMMGRKIMQQSVRLDENLDVKLPYAAGTYFLQVGTAKNRYGAMVIIQ